MKASGGLVLGLDNPGYRQQPLSLPEATFQPRPEHHVTLIGRRIMQRLTQPQRDALQRTASELDWSVRTTGQCLLLRREQYPALARWCLIELCAVPSALTLYRQLADLLGHAWPVPPMHITAMSSDGETGIGLYRPADLDLYQRRWLTPAETKSLLVPGRMRVMMLPVGRLPA